MDRWKSGGGEASEKRKSEGRTSEKRKSQKKEDALQYYVRDPAAKDNSITPCSRGTKQPDTAITMRSAETDLQNTIELRAMASEIAAPKPDLDANATKRRF